MNFYPGDYFGHLEAFVAHNAVRQDPGAGDEPLAEYVVHQRSAGSIIAVEPCKLLKISGGDSVKAFKRSLELSALEVRHWDFPYVSAFL